MKVDKHEPHPFTAGGMPGFAGEYDPPPWMPKPLPDAELACEICGKAKSDPIHKHGEEEADAESPKWG